MAKILAVDDEPGMLQVVINSLKPLGHEMFKADDGAKAIETAKKERPDIVMLDMRLPDMDGLDILLEIKKQLPDTRVIMGYIESLRDGDRFIRVAREVSRKKPIVVMKFGRTTKGSAAASSHTGALAGPHAVYRAAFRQSGVIEVTRTHDLLNVAMALSMQPPLRGPRIGIAGASGGFAVAGM